jgi:hypothetical protein
MSRSTKKKEEDKKEPPITHGEVTKDRPHGIESVSEEHAIHIGGLRGFGGPGAAGATVAGPAVHVATEGGTKPLPVKDLPEDVETSGGAEPRKDDLTSQTAALKSGKKSGDGNGEAEEESDSEEMPFKDVPEDELTPAQKGAQTKWKNVHGVE